MIFRNCNIISYFCKSIKGSAFTNQSERKPSILNIFSKITGILLGVFFMMNTSAQIIVQDSSFEAGHPNSYWIESSTNFTHTICNSLCGTVPGVEPHSGSYFVWLGGSSAQPEIGSVEQNFSIPKANYAQLSFYLKMPAAAPNMSDYMHVEMDSLLIFQVTPADSSTYGFEFVKVSIDVSSWADGNTHNLRFVCNQSTVNGITNFIIDDVGISINAGIAEIIADSLFNLYPQPAENELNLWFHKDINQGQLYILNMQGQEILSRKISQPKIKINVSSIPSGVYLLIIRNEKGLSRKKIIIK